jgi:hypothetical protein
MVNPLSDHIEVQFKQLTRDKAVLTVRDIDQGLLFGVDMNGQLLIRQPVQATQPPAVDYDREGRVIRMFIINNERIEILNLPL